MLRSPKKKQVANITQKGCVVEDKLDVRPGWILAATGTEKVTFKKKKSGFDIFFEHYHFIESNCTTGNGI